MTIRPVFVDNLINGVRNAARAMITREGRVLLPRKDGAPLGERYALPGGAQEMGETLEQALNRECLEEIGTRVRVRDLRYVAETEDGPIVFEVSAFGGFRGAKEGMGLDAAGRYTDYVLKELAQ